MTAAGRLPLLAVQCNAQGPALGWCDAEVHTRGDGIEDITAKGEQSRQDGKEARGWKKKAVVLPRAILSWRLRGGKKATCNRTEGPEWEVGSHRDLLDPCLGMVCPLVLGGTSLNSNDTVNWGSVCAPGVYG